MSHSNWEIFLHINFNIRILNNVTRDKCINYQNKQIMMIFSDHSINIQYFSIYQLPRLIMN